MIGEALRLARIFHGKNKAEMALDVKISNSYISEIESGKKQPSIEVLQRYATELNVPLSSLIFFSEEVSGMRHSERLRLALAPKVLRLLAFLAEERDEFKK